MTAAKRLSLARAVLATSVLASAVLWGAFVALTMDTVTRLAWTSLYQIGSVFAIIAAAAAALTVLWRGRFARSRSRVALWLEERLPSLQYALVTVEEPQSATTRTALESIVSGTRWTAPLRSAAIRAIGPPLGGVAAMLGVVLLTGLHDSASLAARVIQDGTATSDRSARSDAPSGIASIRASIVSPAYSRQPNRTLDNPSTIDALVGSLVTVAGGGSPEQLSARVEAEERTIVAGDGGWVLQLTMPARPSALRLSDRSYQRLLVLEPQSDSVPQVTLIRPARDTVFRNPTGSLELFAEARDDFGLTLGWLEYIISSGEGESFTFRSGVLQSTTYANTRSSSLRTLFSVDSLALEHGDVAHVRAVARDNNSVSGPNAGYSETRTLRIGRMGEYDSIAVEGAPPPENVGEVSQRMLIIMTEELQKKRSRLTRPTVVSEAGRISQDQARLRRRVGEIIYARLGGEGSAEHSHDALEGENQSGKLMTPAELLATAEAATGRGVGEPIDFHGDETPVVAVNRPLLEAFNAMWEAGRELDIGEPDEALPHMRAALAAIQRARAAERIYLRGRAPTVVIDLAKVRLAARIDSVEAEERTPRSPLHGVTASRSDRLSRALGLMSRDGAAALDSLLLMRLDAIGNAPAFARELGVAIEAIRQGRDATYPLLRARRVAAGQPDTRAGLSDWSAPR